LTKQNVSSIIAAWITSGKAFYLPIAPFYSRPTLSICVAFAIGTSSSVPMLRDPNLLPEWGGGSDMVSGKKQKTYQTALNGIFRIAINVTSHIHPTGKILPRFDVGVLGKDLLQVWLIITLRW